MKRKALATALLSGLALLGTACGQTPSSTDPGIAGGTAGTTGTNPTGTGTPTPNNTPPNYQFHFSVHGSGIGTQIGGGAMAVATDTVLRISVTAGNGMPLQGTGFTVGFNCELFNIKVGNVTQTAFVKKSSYVDTVAGAYPDPCASAQTTWTGDFSGALSPGHQTLNIQVLGNAQTDNCHAFDLTGWGIYSGGCPMTTNYSQYDVDAFVAAFTD